MNQDISTLSAIRQVFSGILSIKEHKDTKIPTFELVVGFVFHFIGQAKSLFRIEDFRRAMILQTGQKITPPAFHDRLNTKKLSMLLYQVYTSLTEEDSQPSSKRPETLSILKC